MRYDYDSPALGIDVDLPTPSVLNSRETCEKLDADVETALSLAGLLVAADRSGRPWRGLEGSRLEVIAVDGFCGWTFYGSEGEAIDSDADWLRLPAFLDEPADESMMVFTP